MRLKRNLFFQAKLSINQPNDIYEQEADAMADKVMRMSINKNENTFFKPVNILQRKCAHCEDEEKLHLKGNGNGEAEAGNEVTNYIGNINSGGTVLPEQVRSFFEPRFGYDFSNVRIHKDSVAAKSAQSINALAYTSGNNIVFNQNQYSPETDRGKRLLAHELTHVVQQTNSGHNSLISRAVKECEPDHVLTWADYSGAIPRGATVGAITLSGVQKVMDNGKPKFQGILDSACSWALEKHKSASDNTKNGCQQQIDDCKTFAKNNPRKLPSKTDPRRSGACPASVAPQAVEFRNEAECTSKVGAECKRAIVADSALL
ncbi:MAG: DUF4157 domain-containing protein [Ignavibacteria bacterium]|nr:DUF4157 domain-containing protein [Ignavibacteria bacterium]